MARDTIVLAGGCFWCLEPVFQRLEGVYAVRSGYTGGTLANPSYDDICTGQTGHAEVIEVSFDPEQISLMQLLAIFFAIHDTSTLNRQGADIGSQYRSAIFYASSQQLAVAQQAIEAARAQGYWPNPIVTSLEQLTEFYPAEDYHQDFFSKNPSNRYCQLSVLPKLAKLEQLLQNIKT